MNTLALFIVVFLLVPLFGCGDDVVTEAPFVPREEVLPKTECDGCLEDGTCLDGDTDDSCGSRGDTCAVCEDDTTCESGRCVAPTTCESTCDGCCDADGECQPGDDTNSCGSDGETCSACAESDCVNGACEMVECNAETCTGCCDALGVCQAGDQAEMCGAGAISCNDCASVGTQCVQGICMVDPNSCSQTCAGCCDGETCVDATGEAACGIDGSACEMCVVGDLCIAGVCGEPMASNFYNVEIISASVASTKPSGAAWDAFDNIPDLFAVGGAVDLADTTYAARTSGTHSELNTTWNVTLMIDAPIEAINNLFQLELWDEDTFENDVVCVFNPPIDANVLAGIEQQTVCADDAATTLRWRLVPLP